MLQKMERILLDGTNVIASTIGPGETHSRDNLNIYRGRERLTKKVS